MALIMCPQCGQPTESGKPCGGCDFTTEVAEAAQVVQPPAFRLLKDGDEKVVYSSIAELFKADPEVAAWFAIRTCATYLAYDEGGTDYRYERLK